MGDVFESTARQGFKPDEPYPDGVFNCHLRYMFPSGSSSIFVLALRRERAPGWSMTFSDVADDLEALWYAALWFEGRIGGFPESNFEVYRSARDSGGGKKLFLASSGSFEFALHSMANVSDA